MKQPFKFSLLIKIILFFSFTFPSTSIDFSIGEDGVFSIPFQWDIDINEYISLQHINRIYHTKHPHIKNLQTSNTRSFNRYGSHLTGITEISVIKYKKNRYIILLALLNQISSSYFHYFTCNHKFSVFIFLICFFKCFQL